MLEKANLTDEQKKELTLELTEYEKYLIGRKMSLGYWSRIKILLTYCKEKNIDIKKFSTKDWTTFITTKNLAPVTINSYIVSAKNYLRDYLKIDTNELMKEKRLKVSQKSEPEVLTENDLKTIVEKIYINSEKLTPLKVKAILYILFYTGMRKNELIENLRQENINFRNNSLFIRDNKEDRAKTTYFNEETKYLLQQLFKEEPIPKITRSQINYLMRKISKILNRKIWTHLFRYSYIHYQRKLGVPEEFVMKTVGHSQYSTFRRYSAPSDNEVKEYFVNKNKTQFHCSIGETKGK
jgi:integrase